MDFAHPLLPCCCLRTPYPHILLPARPEALGDHNVGWAMSSLSHADSTGIPQSFLDSSELDAVQSFLWDLDTLCSQLPRCQGNKGQTHSLEMTELLIVTFSRYVSNSRMQSPGFLNRAPTQLVCCLLWLSICPWDLFPTEVRPRLSSLATESSIDPGRPKRIISETAASPGCFSISPGPC